MKKWMTSWSDNPEVIDVVSGNVRVAGRPTLRFAVLSG